jgi:iron complex outermembrane receptor protein
MNFIKIKVLVITSFVFGAVYANEEIESEGSIIVIGEELSDISYDLAGSVDVISREELDYEHVDDTLEIFTKIPGLYISRFNQGIINTDISIRGFANDGDSPHAKLLIDGIPSNLHNGYGETDQLFPMGMKTVQVFKGTADPRYGLFNIAGNYNILSRDDIAKEVEVTYGSFEAKEIQGYTGLKNGDLTHNYFLGYRQSEGYRDHTNVDKYVASGRWFYDFNENTSLGLIARTGGYEGDAPGYLDTATARSNPTSSASFANQDGGDKTTHHISLHFDTQLIDNLDWSIKSYFQNFERERWVRFLVTSSLQNRYDDQDHYGFLSTLSYKFNDKWKLNWGINIEYQDVIEQRFGTIGQTRQRDTSTVIRNFHYDFDTFGTYLQIEHTPNEYIAWNASVRADQIDGHFSQFTAAGVETVREVFDFGTLLQPKFNLFITPNEQITLFGNFGRSFQHPFGSSAYTTGSTQARELSINDGWEAGIKWSALDNLDLRISYWEQEASDEFVNVDGVSRNVGETSRDGIDFAFNWYANHRLYLWGNYSIINSEIVKPSSAQAATVGNELRSIPEFVSSVGINYDFTPKLTARIHVDSQGNYYANEANVAGQFGDYTLVNANLDYQLSWGNINLQVNNILDEFHEYVYDFNGDGTGLIHSPGDGINASLSVGIEF